MSKQEKPVTLRELKNCIDQAVARLDEDQDAEVEVWYKKKGYRIFRVGQFGIVPDVTLTIGEKFLDFSD
jgi:hypothetical protein